VYEQMRQLTDFLQLASFGKNVRGMRVLREQLAVPVAALCGGCEASKDGEQLQRRKSVWNHRQVVAGKYQPERLQLKHIMQTPAALQH
jgi:hypothetical protein